MKDLVFPIKGSWYPAVDADRLEYSGSFGLTKRELFAAMAMQAVCSSQNMGLGLAKGAPTLLTKLAVECADALIKELEKEQ